MKRLSYTAIAMVMLAGTACAGDKEQMGSKDMQSEGGETATFSQLDTNQDGYISSKEAQQHEQLNNAFDQLDTDTDGRLSAEEFSDYAVEPRY